MYDLWTDDTDAERGKFGRGDGGTTFVLPNYAGVFEQFGEDAGKYVGAGLPNITGSFCCYDLDNDSTAIFSGAFRKTGANKTASGGSRYGEMSASFDAARSNAIYGSSDTVQPPAITLIPIIRY